MTLDASSALTSIENRGHPSSYAGKDGGPGHSETAARPMRPPETRRDSATWTGSIEIVLIDSRNLLLECLSCWLSRHDPDYHVHTHRSVGDALEGGRGLGPGSVILYNIGARTARDPDIVEDIAQLSEELPHASLALISDCEEAAAIVEALEQGVRGYITPNIGASVLVGAIHLIKAGGTFVPVAALTGGSRSMESAPQTAEEARALEHFTPRQMQVLTCLRQGKANKMIAYELDMCESTVKVHVRHIMKKLKATNRTQVAYLTNSLFDSSEMPLMDVKQRNS